MSKIFRFNNWWPVIIPQVLGWIYFCFLFEGLNVFPHRDIRVLWFGITSFFISLVCISAFGYLFNDWCDRKSDNVTLNEKTLSKLKPAWQLIIVVIPLIVGCFAWIQTSRIATLLFALQIILLIAYSAPPVRLKNRGFWGVAADAFYGHVNPVFITLFAFNYFSQSDNYSIYFIGSVLFVATTLKGIRNILLHQISDRKKDRQAGIQTFVVNSGALFTLYLINNLLFFEIIFTVVLSLIISFFFPPFFICLLFFSSITYLKFSGWKLSYLPQRQIKFKFLNFINDYYEGWVPVFFLILLSVRQHEFLFLLLLHLVLFPSFVTKLWNDTKTIKQNFKTEDEY